MIFLITGTSRGVGKALSQHLCTQGHKVVGLSRSPQSFTQNRYSHVQADINDGESIKAVFKGFRAKKLMFDALINNAGIAHESVGLMTSDAVAKGVIDTNVMGTFLVTRESAKLMMRNGKGSIITLSSINVPLVSKGSALYSASKSACEMLMKSFSREMAPHGLRFNTVGLSVMAGEGMAEGLDDKSLKEKFDNLDIKTPISVEELAHVVLFLTSPLSKSITGQTLYFGGP